jgi:hypothetical protein
MRPAPPHDPRLAREDAIDDLIRRRFRHCQTLPLFPATLARPAGFFELPPVGQQLRIFDGRAVSTGIALR